MALKKTGGNVVPHQRGHGHDKSNRPRLWFLNLPRRKGECVQCSSKAYFVDFFIIKQCASFSLGGDSIINGCMGEIDELCTFSWHGSNGNSHQSYSSDSHPTTSYVYLSLGRKQTQDQQSDCLNSTKPGISIMENIYERTVPGMLKIQYGGWI